MPLKARGAINYETPCTFVPLVYLSAQIYGYYLKASQTFPKVHTRTQRYCSFIQYGLNHYR